MSPPFAPGTPASSVLAPEEKEEALALFQELLRFPTISYAGPTNGSYRACCEWLVKTLTDLGLKTQVLEVVPNKPVVVGSWEGSEPALPSVLLNSHYDVVPACLDQWDTEPFTPVRKGGKIYARGTQDMKCVCAQYILAIKRLKKPSIAPAASFQPRRSIHLSFVPDEEIGGEDGMGRFLESDLFRSLHVGLALDEGIASPENSYKFFYSERSPLWIRVRAKGLTGHGSRFIPDTAVEKIMHVANQALAFRASQEKRLGYPHPASNGEGEGEEGKGGEHGGCKHALALKLGDVATLNLTVLKAGVSMDNGQTFAYNVIPHEAEAGFDMRIPPSMPFAEVRALLDAWTDRAGVTWEFAQEGGADPLLTHHATSIDGAQNPWFSVFHDALTSRGVPVIPEVFPAATDARFLRARGISAFGFSPMRETAMLLHEHNEYVSEEVFMEGVEVYVTLVEALSGAPRFEGEGAQG